MKYTFQSDESMVITIPIGSLKDAKEGQLLPENFHCVFKDFYKVFLKGKPKALGASQVTAGVFTLCISMLLFQDNSFVLASTVPSVMFVASGMVSFAAGHAPNMCVAKLSFIMNIISFFWSVAAVCLCSIPLFLIWTKRDNKEFIGVIVALLVFEMVIALVLIYWESKAICRQHFNILPMVTLKQETQTQTTCGMQQSPLQSPSLKLPISP